MLIVTSISKSKTAELFHPSHMNESSSNVDQSRFSIIYHIDCRRNTARSGKIGPYIILLLISIWGIIHNCCYIIGHRSKCIYHPWERMRMDGKELSILHNICITIFGIYNCKYFLFLIISNHICVGCRSMVMS